jgi:hypothetical protein
MRYNGAKPSSHTDLEIILSRLDKEDLTAFLLEYAAQNDELRDTLLIRFSEKADVVEHAKNIIRSSINGAKHHGFVDYRNARRAVGGTWQILTTAAATGETGDILTAVKLCITVLREMVKLINHADDSDGTIGDPIRYSLELLSEITGKIKSGYLKGEEVFNVIFKHAMEKIYDGWEEWRLQILESCVPLCYSNPIRKKLQNQLESMIPEKTSDSYIGGWILGNVQNINYKIMSSFDDPEIAFQYIEENLDNRDFRKIAIEHAVAEKKYERALELCSGGEKAETGYKEKVDEWQHLKYMIYEEQKDITKQKELALMLTLGGDFSYYQKLKTLYLVEEWPDVLQNILEKLEKSSHKYGVYIQICIHEHLQEKLLAYCRENHSSAVELYPHLIPKFSDELNEIFMAYIRQEAIRASNRHEYKAVTGIIKHQVKACGKEKAKFIIAELLAAYPRRPAFIDELNKIKV